MSRLDELIEKLCPDGAEFLTLQECTQKVKNIKWKSYSGNDKKYIDLSSVDRDLHCCCYIWSPPILAADMEFVPPKCPNMIRSIRLYKDWIKLLIKNGTANHTSCFQIFPFVRSCSNVLMSTFTSFVIKMVYILY